MVNGAIKPTIFPLSYEFGGMTPVPEILLFPNGSCIEHLPENEKQIGVYFDDWGCVSHSILNGLEVLIDKQLSRFNSYNRKWVLQNIYLNEKPNFSDRDLVVLSGTKIGKGNSGEKVLATAQEKGVVAEHKAPWDFNERNPNINSPERYYAYSRMASSNVLAQEFNERFIITGEWVPRTRWFDASKYGVLQVYVNAWYQRNGKYYNPNNKINHAVLMADYKGCKIFDSYDPYIKQLESWNDAYPVALKINIIEKNMTKPNIPNNALVILVEGLGGIGLYLDNKIIVDDEAKINSVFMMRNSKNGFFSGGPTVSLTQEQWDLFSKTNLKGELI